MPTNTIEISWSEVGGIDAKVWDKNGIQHDISSLLQEITGSTGTGRADPVTTKLILANANVSTTLEFRPSKKEFKYEVPEKVIVQILEALS